MSLIERSNASRSEALRSEESVAWPKEILRYVHAPLGSVMNFAQNDTCTYSEVPKSLILNYKFMTPITTLPERTLDITEIPAEEREELLSSPCTLGPAENEPDSNPRLRSNDTDYPRRNRRKPGTRGAVANAAPRGTLMGIFNERLYG